MSKAQADKVAELKASGHIVVIPPPRPGDMTTMCSPDGKIVDVMQDGSVVVVPDKP